MERNSSGPYGWALTNTGAWHHDPIHPPRGVSHEERYMTAAALPSDVIETVTTAALEEKAKLRQHFGRFDIFFFQRLLPPARAHR
jgi:hypothetical protein